MAATDTVPSVDDLTHLRIKVDPAFDLAQAGHPNDDAACEDFADAYTQAGEAIGKAAGVRVDVIVGRYGNGQDADAEGEGLIGDTWQDIHDAVYRDEETGEWVYDEKAAAEFGKRLRGRVATKITGRLERISWEACRAAINTVVEAAGIEDETLAAEVRRNLNLLS